MPQRTLNLSCVGRDAFVRDWLFGESWATVTRIECLRPKMAMGL